MTKDDLKVTLAGATAYLVAGNLERKGNSVTTHTNLTAERRRIQERRGKVTRVSLSLRIDPEAGLADE